jgi:hypothetical protein
VVGCASVWSFTVTRLLDQESIETERLLLRSWDAADASVMQRELSKVEMARMLAIPYPYPEEGRKSGSLRPDLVRPRRQPVRSPRRTRPHTAGDKPLCG